MSGEEQEEAGGGERSGQEAPGGEADREERAGDQEAGAHVAEREEEAEAGRLGRRGREGVQWEPPETQAEWQAL